MPTWKHAMTDNDIVGADRLNWLRAGGARTGPSRRVAAAAAAIFDGLGHVHGLTRTWRPVLGVAVAIGGTPAVMSAAPRDKLTACADVLRELPHDLTRNQSRILLGALDLVFRGRRAITPQLGPPAQEAARDLSLRLGALLRLAEALGRDDTAEAAGIAALHADDRRIDLLMRGPDAEVAAAAGARRRDLWNAVMPQRINSVRAVHGFPAAEPLVFPSDTIAAAGLRVLRRQMSVYGSRERGLAFREDPEHVHEMRIATRRMREALRLFRKSFRAGSREWRAGLRRLAHVLGAARDTDVLLAFLRAHLAAAADSDRPFLERFLRSEEARRNRSYRVLLSHVGSDEHVTFRDRFLALVSMAPGSNGGLDDGDRAPHRTTSGHAPRALKKRLKHVLAYDRSLLRYSAGELHELRIACKHLRYACEFLSDVYPRGLDDLTSVMTRMQSLLGNVHDADVYAERLQAYCRRRRRRTAADRNAVTALEAHLQAWRSESLEEARTTWKDFRCAGRQRQVRNTVCGPYSARSRTLALTCERQVSVSGKLYSTDICISVNGKVRERDKRNAGALYGNSDRIGPEELRRLCRGGPKILFLGTGLQGDASVTTDGITFLERNGIALQAASSGQIAGMYNAERRPKAALIVVTC